MKKIKTIIALVLTAASLLSFTACTKRTAGETLYMDPSTGQLTGGSSVSEPTPTKPLAQKTFEENYGYQLSSFLNRQYYFEGEPIPVVETNYYFIDSFMTINQYALYGGYPMLEGGFVDLTAAMSSDPASPDASKTYGDLLVEYAERVIESTCIVIKHAKEEGLTLPEESSAAINEMINNFNTQFAAPEGITLDQLFALFYGEGCGEAEFRQIMEDYYLAEYYTSHYIDEYEFTDEELYRPQVRYALYSAPEDTATQEERDSQQALANALFEECNGDIDMFELLGNTRQNNGEVTQYGDIPVSEGQTVPVFNDWVFDESRQAGDMDLLYAPEYGYFVVGYVGLTEIDYSEKSQIAVAALGDMITEAIDNGEYQFYTNDPVGHVPNAEEIAKIKAGTDKMQIVLIVLLFVGIVLLAVAIFLLIRSRKKAASEDKKGGKKTAPKKKVKEKEPVEESDEDEDEFM